jgi:hypothetical protein
MAKDSQHVAPAMNGGWIVRKSGSARATKHFDTQNEAVEFARQISMN